MSSQLRALRGKSMIEVAEMMRAFKLDECGEVPFSRRVLRSCSSNSVFELIPLAALSILYLKDHFHHLFFAREQDVWWEKDASFASHSGDGPRWHLIRKNPLLTMSGTRWNMEAMKAQIPVGEQLLPARVLVGTALLLSMVRGECWLQNFYAPSSDTVNGCTVCVGYNESVGGLDVVLERGYMYHKFGLVTEMKPKHSRRRRNGDRHIRSGQVPA